MRWAETIAKNSPMSIRASKQAIQKGLAVSLEQAMAEQRDYPAVKAMAASQDYIEGPKAFAEKRRAEMAGEVSFHRECHSVGFAKRRTRNHRDSQVQLHIVVRARRVPRNDDL